MPNESKDQADHPLKTAVELLQRHGVEFVVIGGQAELMMGSPRITYDVDFCYRRTPESIRRLADALNEIDVKLRGVPVEVPFKADARTIEAGLNFTFESKIGPIDLLGEVEPIGGYEQVMERAEWYEVWGRRFPTISLDDLLRVKQHIARPRDADSIYQLKCIKRAREEEGRGGTAV